MLKLCLQVRTSTSNKVVQATKYKLDITIDEEYYYIKMQNIIKQKTCIANKILDR